MHSLWLHITYLPEAANYSEVVGEGAVEEITLNGEPAALLRGGWNSDTQSYDMGIHAQTIKWFYDEHTVYALKSSDDAMEVEDLIGIAESIP